MKDNEKIITEPENELTDDAAEAVAGGYTVPGVPYEVQSTWWECINPECPELHKQYGLPRHLVADKLEKGFKCPRCNQPTKINLIPFRKPTIKPLPK